MKKRGIYLVTSLHLTLISDEVHFIKSSKGHPILVDKRGYYYYKANNSLTKQSQVTWRCQRKNQKCYARAVTDGWYIIKYKNEHNHSPVLIFDKE